KDEWDEFVYTYSSHYLDVKRYAGAHARRGGWADRGVAFRTPGRGRDPPGGVQPGVPTLPPPGSCSTDRVHRTFPGTLGVRRPCRTTPLGPSVRAQSRKIAAGDPGDLRDHDQPCRPPHHRRPGAPPPRPGRQAWSVGP